MRTEAPYPKVASTQDAISPIFLATLDVNPEVLMKVKNIKAKCDIERKEAIANKMAGSETKALLVEMMGAVNHGGKAANSWDAWQKISIAIDSGAAATDIPHTMVTEYPIVATAMSEAGVCYVSATGEPIPNLGEQRLPLATVEGSLRAMTFQAAPVAKPLGSVKKMCQAGHMVVFDDEGSYIYNKQTQEINWLREESGNYMLDVWLPPAAAAEANGWQQPHSHGSTDAWRQQPFRRQS